MILLIDVLLYGIIEERTDGKTGRLYQPTSKIAEKVYAKKQEEEDKAVAEAKKVF